MRKIFTAVWFLLVSTSACMARTTKSSFEIFRDSFISQYLQLDIPGMEYDYHNYFNNIPGIDNIEKQSAWFGQQHTLLAATDKTKLNAAQRTEYDHIDYEIDFNLYRLSLEKQWVNNGRHIPGDGLHSLDDHKAWYTCFIKKFTSTNITPEEIFALGQSEVKRVQQEIKNIRLSLGYADSVAFYRHLQDDSFYISDKAAIIRGFENMDSTVRKHLPAFIGLATIPAIYAMEWPDAGPNTPPGIYMNHSQTAYGKDVFQFNFYGRQYNSRAMEWLYMHEAIPGHHLQATFRKTTPLQDLFLYPGNFEGWGCYVEYHGKEFGLYKDPYAFLGKWEWDLVRSARLVLDAGIHYYGWTRQQALDYWKATIPGQDDIAEREITRVTNWCAQALSYKVGAHYIEQMKRSYLENRHGSEKAFHLWYLQAGMLPLEVLKKQVV